MRPETPFMMMPMDFGVVASATVVPLRCRERETGRGVGTGRRAAAGKRLPECMARCAVRATPLRWGGGAAASGWRGEGPVRRMRRVMVPLVAASGG
ncbi:hypothetical protein GCM10009573_06600 [Agromyces bracchium]